MIDFHSHLDLYRTPRTVVQEIMQRKMYVLSVTTTPSAWIGTTALVKHYPRIKTALGLHPELAHERHSELELFDTFIDETDYVGEVGLDGSPAFAQHSEIQKTVLRHILHACTMAGGKIISIHSRRAAEETIGLISEFPDAGIPVLHWYTGGQKELRKAVEMGCWFSVGPAMLRSKRARELIAEIPRSRILTETDGPFATNGNDALWPWDVQQAVVGLSTLWACTPDEANQAIYLNFKKLLSQKSSSP